MGTKSGAIKPAIDGDQANVRVAESGADAIDIRPGTLPAGRDGVGGGLGQGGRDDIADGRRDNGDNGGDDGGGDAMIVFNMTGPRSNHPPERFALTRKSHLRSL